nr:fasciclin domain-containing protein [Haliscomenobacter sp.]
MWSRWRWVRQNTKHWSRQYKPLGWWTYFQTPDPFTVFAPTDAAFGALPKGTVEDLLKEKNRDKLTDILQYHVAVAGYPAEVLTDGRILSMVNGGSATISNKDGVIMINDAKVVTSVKASNGIVHVIDKVILPKAQ